MILNPSSWIFLWIPAYAGMTVGFAKVSIKGEGDMDGSADDTLPDGPSGLRIKSAMTDPAAPGPVDSRLRGNDGGGSAGDTTLRPVDSRLRGNDGEGRDATHRHSGLDAESRGGAEFDLIICDEAHRTTGVESSASGDGGSYFTAVHDNDRLCAKKRLYMTATPRIYSDSAKTKARDIGEVALYSMDDESQYGPEFHRMTFADAVENGHLSDYKVIVLNVEESFVDAALQRSIAAGGDAELNLDDAAKILGCSKALIAPEGPDAGKEVRPLQRAIAFSTTIKNSKRVTESWETIVNDGRDEVLTEEERSRMHAFDVDHVDGGMNALLRNRKLHWLRQSEEEAPNACRILSNARCLTEGVDVPALDAVLFLQPRRSMVDVVQAVGRVMRTAPGKKTGYVILPIVIPAGVRPEDALDDNRAIPRCVGGFAGVAFA